MNNLTPEEQTLVQFEVAKENLIDQMVLYGIIEAQARIQVESLVTLTMKAKEAIDAVRGAQEGVEVRGRQAQEER